MGLKILLARFAAEERGATALEYGLIVGVIAIAIVGGVTAVGSSTANSFNETAGALEDANTP
ncbi:MAG: Flp family type IVb pilin [Hyphomonas sp.]|uniref:Flp family type IVb pilin n=1 Tax=Hyphomonas sp. BRH_c22 TaxID=1629710 RepID=UPI000B154C54|nr:Flp family type IVb pilin [Hyphomonas sp. BRH_c22]